MILKVGELYQLNTDEEIFLKPNDLKEHERIVGKLSILSYLSWPSFEKVHPDLNLIYQPILFLGTECYKGDELYKFLWNNRILYIRKFSKIEFDYRFEEVEENEYSDKNT